MINPVSRPLILVTVLCVMVVSGCIEADIAEDSPSWPDAATLEAPTWSPGDYWNYVDDKGQWKNHTVEAIEEREGRTTYRVRIQENEADRFGVSERLWWADVQTLGTVAFREDDNLQITIDPPGGQRFPMVNRTYTYTLQASTGYQSTFHAEYRVAGWSEVATPAGTFSAVKVSTEDKNTNVSDDDWYSPRVGNSVLIPGDEPDDPEYLLASWQYAASSE